MSIEGPSNTGEANKESLDVARMEKELVERGIKFPKNWTQFDDGSKLRAIDSFNRGGLTPLGFETLTPDWLDRIRDVGEEAEQQVEEIDREQETSKGKILH